MKIYLKLPGGAEFTLEREPMDKEKLYAVCVTICIVAAVIGFFSVFIFSR